MVENEPDKRQLAATDEKLKFPLLAAYGSGGVIPIALFNITGILVGLMGNISLGLSAFWLGVILIIPRLWDAVSDPLIGHLSDNARTRWGRRRPFILVGGLLVALFFVVIWWIPQGSVVRGWFPTEQAFQWFQLSYLLVTLILFFTSTTIFEIPHGSLGMEMTTDPHARTRLFSAKSFVGNLFAMSTPWLFALANMEIFRGVGGTEVDGMRYVSILVALILLPLSLWWFFSLREPGFHRIARQKKSPFWHDMKKTLKNRNFILLTLTIFTLAMGFNFVSLLGSYIPIFYVFGGDKVAGAFLLGINGTIWAITGLLAVFPLNIISPRLGKRKTLMLSIALMVLAQLSKIVCYNPQYPYLIVIPTVLLSAGMLFFFTLGPSMIGDICDEEDLNTGVRNEGSFYSVFWWFIKMGTALASFVAGALIVLTLFDETQVTRVDRIEARLRALKNFAQTEMVAENQTDLTTVRNEAIRLNQDAQNQIRDLQVLTRKKLNELNSKSFSELPGMLQKSRQFIFDQETITTTISERLKRMEAELNEAASRNDLGKTRILFTETSDLLQQVKMHSSRFAVFDLYIHFNLKSTESENTSSHYLNLSQSTGRILQALNEIEMHTYDHSLQNEIDRLLEKVVPLKKQSSHTLKMMRIVEIGVPVLLSIFSIIFILGYSLTDRRTMEIKDLLRARNQQQKSGNGKTDE
ncbi:MAG TPA: MFS transporter [Bacteroidales bacterium]|nr:MFS transporter [Bacteroidales bacterium]